MKGSLVLRGKSWSAVIDAPSSDGKRKQRWVSLGPIPKKQAQLKLNALLVQADAGELVAPSKETLGTFAESWLRDYALNTLSARTADGYGRIIHCHIIGSTIGGLPITSIRAQHIQSFATSKLDGRSASTVKHILMCLRSIFGSAIIWGLIAKNPCDGVSVPKPAGFEPHVLTEEGVALVLKETPRLGSLGVLFTFLIFVGCRRAEALALTWGDIDLKRGFVSISRGLHVLSRGEVKFSPPKTASSKRCIPMGPYILKAMAVHKEAQTVKKRFDGKELSDNDYVFCNESWGPLLPDSVTHAWSKLMTKLGLPAIRLHDCRHFHASQLLRAGVPAKVVSKRLGHASISTTLNLYTHINETTEKLAALSFDESLTKELERLR